MVNYETCAHGVSLMAPCIRCSKMAGGTDRIGADGETLVKLPWVPDALPSFDPVEKPSHYNQGDIECIDAMIAAYGIEEVRIWAKINSFKYSWRLGRKGPAKECGEKDIWHKRFYLGDDPRKDRKENPKDAFALSPVQWPET